MLFCHEPNADASDATVFLSPARARAPSSFVVCSRSPGAASTCKARERCRPRCAKTYRRRPTAPHSEFLLSAHRSPAAARRRRASRRRDRPSPCSTSAADQTGQRVLSVSARNIPREYEVYYSRHVLAASGQQKAHRQRVAGRDAQPTPTTRLRCSRRPPRSRCCGARSPRISRAASCSASGARRDGRGAANLAALRPWRSCRSR